MGPDMLSGGGPVTHHPVFLRGDGGGEQASGMSYAAMVLWGSREGRGLYQSAHGPMG